jgi:UDP-N-acetylmuramate--alanine ligase
LSGAVAGYRGIERRFEITTTSAGVTVVDDYAHNPEKIRAALAAAQSMSGRVFAVFQPHGFGPTRFLRDDLVEVFSTCLRPGDRAFILPIYYAGGTVQKDISSADLVEEIRRRSADTAAPASRGECIAEIVREAASGDLVLSMGARDPSLPDFARRIAAAIDGR